MNRFDKFFGPRMPTDWNGRVLLPVIHVETGNEFGSALRETRVAYEAGADGVFLIAHSHNTHYLTLTNAAHDVREAMRAEGIDFAVGVNHLDLRYDPDLSVCEAMRCEELPMVWSDNPDDRMRVEKARVQSGWNGIYFGGVAFKYQEPVSNAALPGVAQAASWMDVLTTSGEGTGEAIDLEKARIFAESVPDSIRAVASGASAENIGQILPYFHAILASTSISLDFHTLDPRKTRELADAIHNWRPSA